MVANTATVASASDTRWLRPSCRQRARNCWGSFDMDQEGRDERREGTRAAGQTCIRMTSWYDSTSLLRTSVIRLNATLASCIEIMAW